VSLLATIDRILEPLGLAVRGGFMPDESDDCPTLPGGSPCGTIVLIGNVGGSLWPAFSRSAERADGRPHALDRWTERVLGELATRVGATALYPFGGPPWLPFQRWAVRADDVAVSPLGILIHPVYGLWHAYRGALAFATQLDLPARSRSASPCESCAGRPCLSACPVDAFRPGHYDVATCRAHVTRAAGGACRDGGCLARLACPIGRTEAYSGEQMAFHMAAFLAGR